MPTQQPRMTNDNKQARALAGRSVSRASLSRPLVVAQEWFWTFLLYVISSTICLFATDNVGVAIAFGAVVSVVAAGLAGHTKSVRMYLPFRTKISDSHADLFPVISWQLPLPMAVLFLCLVIPRVHLLRLGEESPATDLPTPIVTSAASVLQTPRALYTERPPENKDDLEICRLGKGVPATVKSEIGVRLRTEPVRDPTNSNVVTMLSPNQQLIILSDRPTYNNGTGWWYVKVTDSGNDYQEIGWAAEYEPGSTASQLIQPNCL